MYKPQSPLSTGQQFTISSLEAGQRLDRYLVPVLPDFSRTQIQQLIGGEAVQVNGRPSKPGYVLRTGDEILLDTSHRISSPTKAQPQPLPLDIVYEDDDLLIVNKAPGMVVHPAAGHHDDTLVNALLAYYPAIAENNTEQRPGIVHRLDRDTSGLLIVAKNQQSQTALIAQMQRHEVIKRYLALVEGNVSLDAGSIDAPIGRDPRHRQQMAITVVGSREARTHFRVQERFARHTLLLIQLVTGRTHQIRVHLKAIGHPVVGDLMYGSGHGGGKSTLHRQFLHACQLQFAHPITGKALQFDSPLPEDLQAVIDDKNFL